MSLIGDTHSMVTRCSRVSRAAPHHSLPAFLNLHDRKFTSLKIFAVKAFLFIFLIENILLSNLKFSTSYGRSIDLKSY